MGLKEEQLVPVRHREDQKGYQKHMHTESLYLSGAEVETVAQRLKKEGKVCDAHRQQPQGLADLIGQPYFNNLAAHVQKCAQSTPLSVEEINNLALHLCKKYLEKPSLKSKKV